MKCCKRHMLFIHIQFNVIRFSEFVLFIFKQNPLFQLYHVVAMLYFRSALKHPRNFPIKMIQFFQKETFLIILSIGPMLKLFDNDLHVGIPIDIKYDIFKCVRDLLMIVHGHVYVCMLNSMKILVSKFDIYVFIMITWSIPLMLDYQSLKVSSAQCLGANMIYYCFTEIYSS